MPDAKWIVKEEDEHEKQLIDLIDEERLRYIVIFIFTFYISVAQDIPLKKRFSEMALISLGIAALTFGIGFLIRVFLHIDI